MPIVRCPVPSCDYRTDDVEAVIVAALLNAHSITHSADTSAGRHTEKIKRPTINSAGTSEDWAYFLTRWEDYVEGTKVTGKDYIIQLLECCDETLRRDLTRVALW